MNYSLLCSSAWDVKSNKNILKQNYVSQHYVANLNAAE